jgi:L-asparaginase type II
MRERPPRIAAIAVALALIAAGGDAQERKPRVVVLATGGTIAGTGATTTTTIGYSVATLTVESLLASLPELAKVAQVRGEQVFQIASENMTPDHWLALSRRTSELLARDDVDGVVITHGTDTLEETAYFLNLTVHSEKPVVLVGAMRPATALSADGPMNLFNAVATAGSREAIGKGVLVAMNDELHAAREVTKTNTQALDTFRSPDAGPLGVVHGGRVSLLRTPTRRHTTGSEFELRAISELPKVDIVFAYAGVSRATVDAALLAGAKGIVWAGVGDGSVALTVRPALVEARKRGVVVVRASRVGSGAVARNGEVNDDELDFVAAADPTESPHPPDARPDPDHRHPRVPTPLLAVLSTSRSFWA